MPYSHRIHTYFLLVVVNFFSIIIRITRTDAFLQSPCPSTFDVSLDDHDRVFGLISLDIAKEMIYDFKVTAEFVPEPNVNDQQTNLVYIQ